MIISTLYKKGVQHINHNEDNFFYDTNLNGLVVTAVMDGCSTGIESQFASQLVKKLIGQEIRVLKGIHVNETNSNGALEKMGVKILESVFNGFKKTQVVLGLEISEMLTTLILCVTNPESKKTWIAVSGDGIVKIDDELHYFDQNNMPNFFGYHLKLSFEDWMSKHIDILEKVVDSALVISTDGIEKMKAMNDTNYIELDSDKSLINCMKQNFNQNTLEGFYSDLRDKRIIPFDDICVIAIKL